MDWLQFLASLVKSLAWPTTLVTLVLLFRVPVRRALLSLTRIRRLECQTKRLHPHRLLSAKFMRMKKGNTECFPLKVLA